MFFLSDTFKLPRCLAGNGFVTRSCRKHLCPFLLVLGLKDMGEMILRSEEEAEVEDEGGHQPSVNVD